MQYVDDDLYCPACGRYFKSTQARNTHLSQSARCAWYRKGKNPEGRRRTERSPTPDPPPADEIPGDVLITPDIPVAQVIQQWEDNLFQFIPADPNQAGPSSPPKNSSNSNIRHPTDHLPDEDDSWVTETHRTVGRVIRMNDNLHAKWKRSFGLAIDPDGDIEMAGPNGPNALNGFAPFASELD